MAEQLFTVKMVAERLRLSELQVRKFIWSQLLPSVRIGRSVRVRASDVEALIRQGIRSDSSE